MKKDTKNVEDSVRKIPKINEDRKELQQLLIQLADEKIYDKYSDKNLDRENEKIKLRDGRFITIGKIEQIIAEVIGKYSPLFTHETEFFSEMYRLNEWNVEDAKNFHKPPIVGKYINEIIYHRFPNGILPILQKLNPYIGKGWLRKYKHFQYLTEEAREQVEVFIREAVKVMKTCDTWYEFRVKYYVLYNIPFEAKLFVDTNKMIDELISNRPF